MKRKKLLLPVLLFSLISFSSKAQNAPTQAKDVVIFNVPALTSVYDAQNIDRLLTGYENKILAFNISIEKSQVQVFYDSNNVQLEDIMQIMWQGGYKSSYRDDSGRMFEMNDSPTIKVTYEKEQ